VPLEISFSSSHAPPSNLVQSTSLRSVDFLIFLFSTGVSDVRFPPRPVSCRRVKSLEFAASPWLLGLALASIARTVASHLCRLSSTIRANRPRPLFAVVGGGSRGPPLIACCPIASPPLARLGEWPWSHCSSLPPFPLLLPRSRHDLATNRCS